MKTTKTTNSALIGKKIIARIERAGVFHGVLDYKDAEITRMTHVRRIYYWQGALSVTDMAVNGISAASKVTVPASVVEFDTPQVVELIECSNEASQVIENITPWKA